MKKEILFFIDSMGGGGAERVVTVLSKGLDIQKYDIGIVMLYKRADIYGLPNNVKTYYVEDFKNNSLYYKILLRIFKKYRQFYNFYENYCNIHSRNCEPIQNTYFYFYVRFILPYKYFLKKHLNATVLGFLIESQIALGGAIKGLNIKSIFCERSFPNRNDIPKNLIKKRNKSAKYFSFGVFQTKEQMKYYKDIVKGFKKVIPNPIKEDLPRKYDGKRQNKIVNFGRFIQSKNLILLIDAFKMVNNKYNDYVLELYGQGPEQDKIEAYIKSNNIKNVYIKSFSPTIHNDILDYKMFVSSSDYEGLSNSMLESMAIGLPVISTDCDGGGARMIIKNYENGIIVPKQNKEALANAMIEIIENEKLSNKLSNNAYKIRNDLSIKNIVKMWEDIL